MTFATFMWAAWFIFALAILGLGDMSRTMDVISFWGALTSSVVWLAAEHVLQELRR